MAARPRADLNPVTYTANKTIPFGPRHCQFSAVSGDFHCWQCVVCVGLHQATVRVLHGAGTSTTPAGQNTRLRYCRLRTLSGRQGCDCQGGDVRLRVDFPASPSACSSYLAFSKAGGAAGVRGPDRQRPKACCQRTSSIASRSTLGQDCADVEARPGEGITGLRTDSGSGLYGNHQHRRWLPRGHAPASASSHSMQERRHRPATGNFFFHRYWTALPKTSIPRNRSAFMVRPLNGGTPSLLTQPNNSSEQLFPQSDNLYSDS